MENKRSRFDIIPDKFKPTKKKLLWSILVAIIIDVLYWLVLANTNIKDIIEPIVDWYIKNIASMLFSISGITIILIIFIVVYIVWSLHGKHNRQ
tara:strand:- start:327 stop:608 length:282 start_codon:yes stop_codon:yes gene_type:complete